MSKESLTIVPRLENILAKDEWTKTTAAIGKGSSNSDSAVWLRNEYRSISRLRYEHTSLVDFTNNNSETVSLYAIDPHIVSGYCDYESESSYGGFEFISDEWDCKRKGSDAKMDRARYLLQLYGAIACHGKNETASKASGQIILNASKQALTQNVAYFSKKYFERTKSGAGNLSNLAQQYSEIADVLEEDINSNNVTAKVALESLARKFIVSRSANDLVLDMALHRFRRFMKLNPFNSLSDVVRLSPKLDDSIKKEFFSVYDVVRQKGSILTDLSSTMNLLWSDFVESTKLVIKKGIASDSYEQRIKEHEERNRELLNRLAINEIHVANYCFAEIGADVQIKYVTSSNILFGFLEHLRSHISVPLVHPRFFFAYENLESTETFKASLNDVLGAASTGVFRIRDDGRISAEELKSFAKYKAHLNVLRDADVFSSAGGDDQLEENLKSDLSDTIHILSQKTKFAEGGDSVAVGELELVVDRFKRLIENNYGSEFRNTAFVDKLVVEALGNEDGVFQILTSIKAEPISESERIVIVRRIRDSSKKTNRLLFLPIAGAYRYMFSIGNSDVVNHVVVDDWFNGGEDKTKVTLARITEAIELITKENATKDVFGKNSALRYYVRAIYAASYRDWTYCDILTEQAIDSLIDTSSGVDNRVGDYRLASIYNLKHELYYLRHLCKRGLAEHRFRLKKQVQYLEDAKKYLGMSAEALVEAYKCGFGNPEERICIYGSATPKLAMAYAALSLEFFVFQGQWGASKYLSSDDLSSSTPFDRIKQLEKSSPQYAWDNMGIDGNLSFASAWDDPRQAIIHLFDSLHRLFQQMCLVKKNATPLLDDYFWNFRKVRCLQIMITIRSMAREKMISISNVAELEVENLDELFLKSMDQHLKGNDRLLGESHLSRNSQVSVRELAIIPYPYAYILTEDIKLGLIEDDVGSDTDYFIERLQAYRRITSACNCLDPQGLPRKHAEMIRRGAAKKLVEHIDGLKHSLERTNNL